MGKYDNKYGIYSNKKIRRFHKSRRMFCVNNLKLYIAKPNLVYSHAEWFEKKGWMDISNDSFINQAMRGIVDRSGDIYFYTGYNFKLNQKIERIFYQYLEPLSKELELDLNRNIYGGLIIVNGKFKPLVWYGKLNRYLDKNFKKIKSYSKFASSYN